MCTQLHETLFAPTVLKLALLEALQKDSKNMSSMHHLDNFANRLTFEKKHIILNETGVSLSQSLFVPFGIMDQGLLNNISQLLESSNTRCVFNDTNKRESVVFALEHVEILGVVDVISAFFLIMNDASDISKKRPENACMADGMLSAFDVLLKSICFKQRVDYPTVIQKCIDYGYGDMSTLSYVRAAEDGLLARSPPSAKSGRHAKTPRFF